MRADCVRWAVSWSKRSKNCSSRGISLPSKLTPAFPVMAAGRYPRPTGRQRPRWLESRPRLMRAAHSAALGNERRVLEELDQGHPSDEAANVRPHGDPARHVRIHLRERWQCRYELDAEPP